MQYSLGTRSFRHHLISITDIARFAKRAQFTSIDLWATHAKNLMADPHFNGPWLSQFELRVSMISDVEYAQQDNQHTSLDRIERLCEQAWRWNCDKIQTYAGSIASHESSDYHFQHTAEQLYQMTERAAKHDVKLLIKTQANTLADNTASILRLLNKVQHPALSIDFDVLNIWCAGEYPGESWQQLNAYTRHLELNNINSTKALSLFSPKQMEHFPADAYASTLDGIFDYKKFFEQTDISANLDTSLTWYGDAPQKTLQQDVSKLRQLIAEKQPVAILNAANG